ncbi:MAG: divalent-cation tolerance protein CutA [Acidobacteria bacterium]|nr:divalent-cation tolerance protein CutA [Acidobacteriota bacterium]
MTDFSVVLTTVSSEEEARRLARSLVQSRLAACVNIISNVTSIYNWKDQMQEDREFLLLIKTRSSLVTAMKAHFVGRHPYEVPEFIAIDIGEGSDAYLGWMGDWLKVKAKRSKVESRKSGRRS